MSLAVELLSWWCVTVGVWMVSLSAYSSHDLVVAVACGLPCAVVAALARRAVRLDARPPAAMVRWSGVLPWSIAVDTARVLVLPWRPEVRAEAGRFRRVRLGPPGVTAVAVGHRAAAAVLMSSTPGAYVIDVDPDTGTALVHSVGSPSVIERRVTR